MAIQLTCFHRNTAVQYCIRSTGLLMYSELAISSCHSLIHQTHVSRRRQNNHITPISNITAWRYSWCHATMCNPRLHKPWSEQPEQAKLSTRLLVAAPNQNTLILAQPPMHRMLSRIPDHENTNRNVNLGRTSQHSRLRSGPFVRTEIVIRGEGMWRGGLT